jgi:predicted alpha/beta-hydrolase family hydrolase
MHSEPQLLFDGPADTPRTVALAHGAGAGMGSPFLAFFAKGLAKMGCRAGRYTYPYTASSRVTGKLRLPGREPNWRLARRRSRC